MGQVFSYIWRRIRRPKNVVETDTFQNDPLTPVDDQSHYITITDVDAAQPDVGTEEEEKQEVVVEKVIQEVVKKEVTSSSTSQVLDMPVKEYGGLGGTVRRIGPYNSMQRILLVGEGDFSFSTSLAVAFGSASYMIATSLNTEEYLTKNYRKFLAHKRELENRGCMLIHDVDATSMARHSVLGKFKFDIIIYNFPHTGSFGRSDDDVRKNQILIRGFVRNAKKMIDEDGEIHITHKTSRFFRQWDIPKIGCDEGLYLIQEIKFKRTIYPGYYTMFGFGGDRSWSDDLYRNMVRYCNIDLSLILLMLITYALLCYRISMKKMSLTCLLNLNLQKK
ncbi:uncharacterized protein At4g26485-like [Silene latifolia]|uniref:uncharacterized protein At4g26485-like n=1 Tax=Silene latifolia TaxID=37657 RepID=UPI003D7864D0